jgi:predicted RNase H-like HicB family nuclease
MIKKKQSIKRNNTFFSTEIEIIILKEGKYFVAYCPALELSSYGKTEPGALSAFEENLDIFFEETLKKETLEKVTRIRMDSSAKTQSQLSTTQV